MLLVHISLNESTPTTFHYSHAVYLVYLTQALVLICTRRPKPRLQLEVGAKRKA